MIKKVLAIFFVTSLPLILFAQNSAIDSARKALNNHQVEDSLKVDLLNELSWEIHRSNMDSAHHYATRARHLAEEINYSSGYGRALNLLAIVARFKEDVSLSRMLNEEALEVARSVNDSTLIAQCLNDLAIEYDEDGEVEKALEYYLESIRYTNEEEILGWVFTLSNVSILYLNNDQEDKAIEYLRQAISRAQASGDSMVICIATAQEGYFHLLQKKYELAIRKYEEALELAYQIDDKISISESTLGLADALTQVRQYEYAVNYLNEAQAQVDPVNKPYDYRFILSRIAQIYLQCKKPEMAIEAAIKALEVADQNHANRLTFTVEMSKILSQAYGQTGDFEKAFQYQSQFNNLSDSLQQLNSQRAIADLEAKYQLEKKEQQNQYLQAQEEKSQLALKNHRIGLIALVLGLMLALLLIAFYWRSNQEKKSFNEQLKMEVSIQTTNLQKANVELQNINEELERFNHIASHDLKEPLRNIIGYIDLIERNRANSKMAESSEYFQFVKTNAHRLYKLVEDVLEVSRVKHSSLQIKEVDVNNVLDQVKHALSRILEERNARISSSTLPVINTSEAELFIILKNLIENGLKYNLSACPVIEFGYYGTNQKGDHQFFVKDNGMGIAPEFHDKIFDMFFRLHGRKDFEGTGLGLAIVKKTLAKLNGSITLKSEEGKGSTFEFSLPAKPE